MPSLSRFEVTGAILRKIANLGIRIWFILCNSHHVVYINMPSNLISLAECESDTNGIPICHVMIAIIAKLLIRSLRTLPYSNLIWIQSGFGGFAVFIYSNQIRPPCANSICPNWIQSGSAASFHGFAIFAYLNQIRFLCASPIRLIRILSEYIRSTSNTANTAAYSDKRIRVFEYAHH